MKISEYYGMKIYQGGRTEPFKPVSDKVYHYGKENEMDIFDKLNGIMDDFGIGKESDGPNLVQMAEHAKSAAKFIAAISDKEAREKAIFDALQQAYHAGVKGQSS